MLVACTPGQPAPDPASLALPDTYPTLAGLEGLDYLATVNGQPVPVTAFERELARYQAGQAALGLLQPDPAAYQQKVLDLLIDQELIRQEAARQGVTITDQQVQAEIDAAIAEHGQEYFDSWLIANFYSLDEFRNYVRIDLLTQTLISPLLASIPTSAMQVHARHILVNSQEEADALLARLSAGEDFAELAEQYSIDVTSRFLGGDLGWFPEGGLLVPEVEEAAFSNAPGSAPVIVASNWGYHIIQSLETAEGRPVDAATHLRLQERAVEEWLAGLRAAAQIEVLLQPPSA